jgi:small-conductance mechanosensitive channel
MRALARIILAAILLGAGPFAAAAQAPDRVPPKAAELLRLLDDPEVRQWLERQRAVKTEPSGAPLAAAGDPTVSALLDARAAIIHEHLTSLAAALPTLPQELGRVLRIPAEAAATAGVGWILLSIAVVLAAGLAAEWLFRRATAGGSQRPATLRIETVGERLHMLALHAVMLIGAAAAFAVGAAGAFFLFSWPPVIREIVLEYLVGIAGLRFALTLLQLLLAPAAEEQHLRIVPLSDPAARFWAVWAGAFAAWFAIGFPTVDLLGSLGLPPQPRRLVAYMLGFGLLVIALKIAWSRPRAETGRRVAAWLLTAYLLLLFVAWVTFALNIFWVALIGGALVLLVRTSHRAVLHVLRPPSVPADKPWQPGIAAVIVDRGLRASLLIGAVLLLAQKWQLDFTTLAANDMLYVRLLRGALGAAVIILLANFAWNLIKAAIDRKLAGTADLGPPGSEEARRQARVKTLLPIVRNVSLVVLIAVAAMMALASLGIEIGPLIAGAGVAGLALGFGAQTLVRDVISGMFYLLDDAFRVGEYIESGTYKGTVESFSLRSVKLRHHRGPLYTVPFGVLGAVKNMSRDWVVDKLTVSVEYNTDVDKVKKLIKQIGRALGEDPEVAPNILGPLKLQGIEEFSDYGITLRMKMTTRPGEQFVVRRMAYSRIKKVFEENGIKFASPTVQVSGEGAAAAPAAAAARRTVERLAASEA